MAEFNCDDNRANAAVFFADSRHLRLLCVGIFQLPEAMFKQGERQLWAYYVLIVPPIIESIFPIGGVAVDNAFFYSAPKDNNSRFRN